ncbi:uncharacterized protein HMPREF1541_00307 [Cyphellophora europaea CBS 101466]|uniref:L-ascorbate oxidase n=1 Tax=Cyphellophora europaea (strain CBS 101466) TaxID=1220924 RepID=W2SDL1_CYPE1|nr:uncharacterized protein HMPREF1541_00307 [Cyphellophora europaea CBS 101466]ETN46123.1 hypothetical protein HMPREF1541_00307 [Cyphellophora europaea CBS 101466]
MYFITALVLSAALGSHGVSGLSRWGGECPWKGRTVQGTHPQHDVPDTGEIRYYDFTIARATIAPDGVDRASILVNGQFPGPLIEANWGDWVEVNIVNDIRDPEEPTSIHWHGFNMPGTPWFDGVPITSQCPLIPGHNLTYRFRADEYGTSWYHSHVSAQYTQGIVGPIVVHGPSDHVEYDEDLGPVLISDWYHGCFTDLLEKALGPSTQLDDIRPLADSNLLAGAGRYPCTDITDGTPCTDNVPYKRWDVEAGKTYRMRFVNTGSSSFFTVSLDSHAFTVMAVDFVPVEPHQVDKLVLSVGQRIDVIFTASADSTQSYWLRASNSEICSDTQADSDALAIIAYPNAPAETAPQSVGIAHPANPVCDTGDISLLHPVYSMPVQAPDLTLSLHLNAVFFPAGHLRYVINNQTFDSSNLYGQPLLHSVLDGVTTFPPENHVYSTYSARIVRLVLVSEFLPPHPMHLHGHDFQVLAQGVGEWDGTITNPINPLRRDVQAMHFGANASDPNIGPNYVVLQYEADNPGVWPIHCHLAWHLAAGMVTSLIERADELQAMKNDVPVEVLETCTLYNDWARRQEGVWGEAGPGLEAVPAAASPKRR